MLFLRRTHELVGVDAGRSVTRSAVGLHAPGVRAYVARMTGGQRFDAGLLNVEPQRASLGAQALCLVLGGELVVRHADREGTVGEGQLASMDVVQWNERWEGDFTVLVLEWGSAAPGPDARLEVGGLASRDRAALTSFAEALVGGELRGEGAAHAVLALLERLDAAGLSPPKLDARQLFEGAPRGAQRLCDALGATLSRLHASPQLVDLSARLGVSERHVRRMLQSLDEWVPGYAAPSGWRRKLRMLRTHVASSYLTLGGVSQEAVARSVGYGSARAMALAFEQEGLPPPSKFRSL